MKIEKIVKKNKNVYQIKFSDNTSLNFYDDTIIKYNLLVNKNVDEATYKEALLFNQKAEAYYKAINYINQKLRTKKEIEKKLKDYNKDIVNEVIAKLEEQKYLNDDIYIKSYINDQINLTLKGPKKIVYELDKLGFKNVDKYMSNINDEVWNMKIEKIISKKEKSNHNLSKSFLIRKIKGDLINLGYSPDLFQDILDNYSFIENMEIVKKEVNKFLRKYQNKYSEEELKYKLKNYLYSKGFEISNIDDLLNT